MALLAQRELARIGHHRLPVIDLLIAGVAHVNGLGVLHYDVTAQHTSPRFESRWLAPAGSL